MLTALKMCTPDAVSSLPRRIMLFSSKPTHAPMYLLQFSPLVDSEYLHHVLVYLCDGLSGAAVNDSAPCSGEDARVEECLAADPIGGWLIGGGVSNTRQ